MQDKIRKCLFAAQTIVREKMRPMTGDTLAMIRARTHKMPDRVVADETAMMTALRRQVPPAVGRTDLHRHTSITNIIHAIMAPATMIRREVNTAVAAAIV
jgi:hypothetical protein